MEFRFQHFLSIACYKETKYIIIDSCSAIPILLMTWPICCRNISVSPRDTRFYSMV